MAKVKKINNVLYVGIPPNIAAALQINEGDDLEFLKNTSNSVLVAKKEELLKMLQGSTQQPTARVAVPATNRGELGVGEIEVLKKLDTIRYAERTKEKINSMMSSAEKTVLEGLIEKGAVTLYRKNPTEEFKYGISKDVYDKFLYRKKQEQQPSAQVQQRPAQTQQQSAPQSQVRKGVQPSAIRKWESQTGGSAYVQELEAKGYLVLKNEVDAASASAALEENIRHGIVLGTRAFDKKFYIGLRGFINKNAPQIMRQLGDKSVKAEEIAKAVGIDEDAVKTVLYILAENGEVTEVRRGTFKLA